MRLPVLRGLIRRRMLVNFRADPEVVQRLLPAPFRPKLHREMAIAGVCLIRLEQIRLAGWPSAMGIASENAAHRIAVSWTADDGTEREGVFIPRRDTGSRLNHLAGGRLFPGEHHLADFKVEDREGRIDFAMDSHDGHLKVRLRGREAAEVPRTSIFSSLAESSQFFERGSLGYSVTGDPGRLDGLRLQTLHWEVRALDVEEVESSYFSDAARFPTGSIAFDHALLMRDIPHEWRSEPDLCCTPVTPAAGKAQLR